MRLVPVAVAVALAASLVACRSSSTASSDKPRPSEEFCAAAQRYDDRVQTASLAEQIRLVTAIAEHAPADIEADARTFLDALRRVRTDDSVRDDPQVEAAVANVNRRAAQDCGWFDRQGL